MKAVYYMKNGGPEVLEYGDVAEPTLAPDTVLIRVNTISIEGGDLLNRQVAPPPYTPYIGGYQAAGVVERVGDAVTRFKPGDRVIGFHWAGSYAELFAVPEGHAYAVPDELDIDVAAIIPVAFGTASDALFEFGQLKPGETVLIQGAAGGVGLAAVQLAAQAGATVIGTSSSPERLDRLRDFGMTHGIDYRNEDIAKRCRELTNGQGVDVVLDMAGGQSINKLVEAVRYRGRYVVVGAATGKVPSLSYFDIIMKSLEVRGVLFGMEMASPRAHALLANVLRRFVKGELRMPIERAFPLSEAVAAHEFVAGGHPFGRVVLKCGQ